MSFKQIQQISVVDYMPGTLFPVEITDQKFRCKHEWWIHKGFQKLSEKYSMCIVWASENGRERFKHEAVAQNTDSVREGNSANETMIYSYKTVLLVCFISYIQFSSFCCELESLFLTFI